MAKMVPKSKCLRKHKLLVLLTAINFWYASGQNCSSHSGFQCGSIGYIAYPFWGGLRPLSCGREEFHLICDQNQDPIINISSLSYRVEELDYRDNTMRVARDDLWDSPCPIVFANTTPDFDNFSFSPEADDRNVTLFFNCSSGEGETPPNKFFCKEQKKNSFNFYKTGNESWDPGSGISCDDSIRVPVNKEKADELQYPTDYSVNVLQSALRTGFVLKWRYFPQQSSATFCNRNVSGSCRPCTTRKRMY